MTTPIENLDDNCILRILNYLDPMSCITVVFVCKKWGELAKRSLMTKVTDIYLNDPTYCYKDRQRMITRSGSTRSEIMKSALEYLGPGVKSIRLGTCDVPTVLFNGYQSYRIFGDFNGEEYFSMLSQRCTNIEELDLGSPFIDAKFVRDQLLQSNGKLKKVILPEIDLTIFSSTFDSIEELNCWVTPDIDVEQYGVLFPNVKNLTLYVKCNALLERFDLNVRSVLQRINKNLESLKLIICEKFNYSNKEIRILSDLSVFSQLEKLEICSDYNEGYYDAEFVADSVKKLIESCKNLRTIKLHAFNFETTDVSSFLTLPKLEDLDIRNAKCFSSEFLDKLTLNQFENLTRLKINFDYSVKFENKIAEFICSVIEKRINDTDIIISSNNGSFRVYKNEEPRRKSKPLILSIESRGVEHHLNKIKDFVSKSEECSFIVWKEKDKGIFPYWLVTYYGMYSFCNCGRVY